MPGERLDAPGAKGQLPDQFLGIVGLQIEQRFLQQGKPGFLLRGQARKRLDCFGLCERADARQQSCNGGSFRDLRLHGRPARSRPEHAVRLQASRERPCMP